MEILLGVLLFPFFLIACIFLRFFFKFLPEERRRRAAALVESKQLEAQIDQKRAEFQRQSTPDAYTIVGKSLDDIVGKYGDSTIYRQVRLSDGRTFTYESVAVTMSPGIFHADFPQANYIIVDKCLLYREVKDGLDK